MPPKRKQVNGGSDGAKRKRQTKLTNPKKPGSKSNKNTSKQSQFDLYRDIDENVGKPSKKPKQKSKPENKSSSTLFTRENSLASMLSKEKPTKKRKSLPFEEDEGFIYKRSQEPDKKTVSTPISRLNRAVENLLDDEPQGLSSPIGTYDFNPKPQSKTVKRRASYNNRGKRVLSIGNGFEGEPHDNIDAKDYYKFLNGSMPDPNRMRQLLVWCFKKTLSQDKGDDSETVRGITKVISDEFLEALSNGKVSTSWYSRADEEIDDAIRPVIPNPLNVTNEENITLFRKKLKQLHKEKADWEKAYGKSTKAIEQLRNTPDVSMEKYLAQKSDSEHNYVSVGNESIVSQIDQTWQLVQQEVPEQLETAMDQLYSTSFRIHKASELMESLETDQIQDKVLGLLKKYVTRTQQTTVPDSISSEQLLRGISRVDAKARM